MTDLILTKKEEIDSTTEDINEEFDVLECEGFSEEIVTVKEEPINSGEQEETKGNRGRTNMDRYSQPLTNSCTFKRKMFSLGEIDSDEWTDRFIEVVRGKPALYNKRLNEYSDRTVVTRMWREVCERMVPAWPRMNQQEKIVKGREIQQRWRNLRTCFKRELNKQRKGSKEDKKRRKYLYFDQLLFLLPCMEDKEGLNGSLPRIECTEMLSEATPSRMDHTDGIRERSRLNEREDFEDYHSDETNTTNSFQAVGPRIKNKASPYQESITNGLKETSSEEYDEDKLFLLSLVPSFKKMTDDQKIEAKIEFLSAIRRIGLTNGYSDAS